VEKEEVMSKYEIYCLLNAGPFDCSGALLMWLQNWDKQEQINYYFWCIKGGNEHVVVDSGVKPELAEAEQFPGYTNPVTLLSRIGVNAAEVRHLVITHLHWDHFNALDLFPKAKIYIQRKEYDFWQKDHTARRAAFQLLTDEKVLAHLATQEVSGRLRLLDGDEEILPGVECILASGHSAGLQAVAVETSQGTAVLGSDSAHVFKNFEEDWPTPIISDMSAWLRSYDKLRAKASSPQLLFPGHDLRLAEDYEKVAEGVTRLA
jgi:glyoxylase-like metal-dependent hydrolase (beta-lactamase superfamily II)